MQTNQNPQPQNPKQAQQPFFEAEHTSSLLIAPLWRRLAAMIYDGLVVCAITMAYGFSAIGVKYGLLDFELEAGERAQIPSSAMLGLFFLIGLFYTFFWTKGGQTVGMRAWRLRVETPTGKTLCWKQSIIRYGFSLLAFGLLGFGYWWQLFDKKGTLHDRLSNSRVIVLAKDKSKSGARN